ncbi:MAG: hypothetical protein FD123_1753 [Bacteroidetes bacterium]|nr:MAG: hypothetical protein FD123_1753 [Bacteroidota bacterium]
MFMNFRILSISGVFFLFCFHAAFAQDSRLLITGLVSRLENGEILPDAVVKIKGTATIAQTGKNGHYAILTEQKTNITVEFIHYGCESQRIMITPELLAKSKNDTLRLDVQLKYKPQEFSVTEIRPGADTVIGNWRFFIEDYMFVDDRYVLLTWEKSLKEAKVMLVSESAGVISQQNIPVEAKELYRDYQGFINVLCKDAVYRVKVRGDNLSLAEMPYEDFVDRMLPCVDTLDNLILFSNYSRDYPAFSYFTYNPADTTVRKIRYIVDEPLMGMYQYEFDYLKPKDRLYARKMEMYTGVDKRIIAATMTGFSKSQFYRPIYAPMFVAHDTICVFDHYVDKLYRFDSQCRKLDSSSIDYHHPKNWRDWGRKLVQDEVTDDVYTIYEKGSFFYLKKIDLKTGKIAGSFKISNNYIKHIRLRDGFVYYIHRPYESVQKKFLYRERIELTKE